MKKTLAIVLAALMTACALPLTASALTPVYTPSDSYSRSSYYTSLTDVSLTGSYHDDLVAVAVSQIGYHEGNSGELSGCSTNGGNYTEYGRCIGFNPNAWCAYFISWCARQAKIPENVIKNNGMADADDFGVTWHEKSKYTPVKGDLIFFDYSPYNTAEPHSSHGDHVGIVEYVQNGVVHTIEGNSSNQVARCSYSLSNSDIKGYGSYANAGGSPAGNNGNAAEPSSEVVDILRNHIGFKASLAYNAKANCYNNYGGSYVGRVYESDIFTVNEIRYYNNSWWARISCPWEGGYNKTVYLPLSEIAPNANYDAWAGTANCQITTYRHCNGGSTTGYIDKGDYVHVISDANGMSLTLYPLAGGGYKVGWIYN